MARMGVHLTKFHRGEKLVPLYSPRTSYKTIIEADEQLLSDISLNFDKYIIGIMKKEFSIRNWQMRLQQFINIVKQNLVAWQVDLPNREYRLIRCLTSLFDEIDINGNGILEWDEFTNYIIQKATILKNLRVKNEEIKNYTRVPVHLNIKTDSPIIKVEYIPDLNRMAFFQEGSHTVHFMDPDTGDCMNKSLVINPKQLVVNMSSVKKNKEGKIEIKKKELIVPTGIRILDLLYINDEKYHLLMTATSDGFVRGWKFSTATGFVLATQPDNQEEFVEHQFSQEIYCIAWDGLNEILFCSQKDGSIVLWNLKTDTEKGLDDNRDPQDEVHTAMVMAMITIPKLHFMASGGMDGKVILWETINNKVKWVYKEHTRGILTLTYNEQLILLFSAGFDHKICIWNPYISTIIHKIEAHSSPIYKLKALEGTCQLVSLDSEGNVKIHDIRRFNFLTSFSVDTSDDTHKLNPNSFTVLNKPLKLCFVGRSVSMFEYDKNYVPSCADQHVALISKYHEKSLRFYTVHNNRIKVWSALTGHIDHVFMEICKSEITAFCMDQKHRSMAVGNIEGKIILLNAKNGAKLLSLPGHNGEVTHIITSTQGDKNLFITAGTDNVINIVKENDQSGYELLRTLNIRKDTNITSMVFCDTNHYIIVGTAIGAIGFYESETGKLVGTLNDQSLDEITSVNRMDVDILVATNSSGSISVLTMPPRMIKFEKLLSVPHIDPEKPGSAYQLGIVTSVYSSSLHKLFVADDKMFLTCYNFDSLHSNTYGTVNFEQTSNKITNGRRHAQKIDKNINFKLEVVWRIKTHTEPLKSLEYISCEELLVTTSYDKTVKIWKATTGQFIDSLQQNYENQQALPLAYQKMQTQQLYRPDFTKVEGFTVPKTASEFQPFTAQEIVKAAGLKQGKSYPDWKLEVKFKENYENREHIFQTVQKEVTESVHQLMARSTLGAKLRNINLLHNASQADLTNQLRLRISQNSQSKILRQSGNEQRDMSGQDITNSLQDKKPAKKSEKVKDPANLISEKVKKSIMSLDPTFEMVSQLCKVKSREELRAERNNHKDYINNLHRQEIQSKTLAKNQTKITLSRKEAEAAIRLSKALFNIDQGDRRPMNLMNSIAIKEDRLPKLA